MYCKFSANVILGGNVWKFPEKFATALASLWISIHGYAMHAEPTQCKQLLYNNSSLITAK